MSTMKKRAHITANKTNTALQQVELELLLKTSVDTLNEMKPKISDIEAYNKLIEVVKESTEQNLTIAEFENKVKNLGEEVLKVVSMVSKFL